MVLITAMASAYAIKWKMHSNVMSTYFDGFVRRKEYVDITLSCSRACLKAHKLILAASSPYFKQLIDENPSPHPTLVFNDIEYQDMQLILDFIYTGQMNVPVERMDNVSTISQYLQIRGLCEFEDNQYYAKTDQQICDVTLPQQLTPQQLEPQQLKPQQLEPQHLEPQQLTPQQLEPQQLTPQQLEPQLLQPQNVNVDEIPTPKIELVASDSEDLQSLPCDQNKSNTTGYELRKQKRFNYIVENGNNNINTPLNEVANFSNTEKRSNKNKSSTSGRSKRSRSLTRSVNQAYKRISKPTNKNKPKSTPLKHELCSVVSPAALKVISSEYSTRDIDLSDADSVEW